MARFDVYRRASGEGLLLDCQADLLSHLNTRFVVPLLREEAAPRPAAGLNPVFEIKGERFLMVTQFAAAVHVRELGTVVQSLEAQDAIIQNAIDLLLTGI